MPAMKFLCGSFVLLLATSLLAGELQDAAARGDMATVQRLIRANPQAVSARLEGTTALHEATRAGHLEVVQALVKAGAQVNVTDFSGLTPLKLALGRKRLEIAAYLREHGATETARPAIPPVQTPTPTAPVAGTLFQTNTPPPRTAVSPIALTTNTPPPSRTVTNQAPSEYDLLAVTFPIHEAARIGDVERIKFLFKHSPDLIDATDEKGLTPLHVAVANRQTNAAQVLLLLGAKVNAAADSGQTALHVAVRKNDLGMARLLLAQRASPNVRDKLDNTPLILAVQSANSDALDEPGLPSKTLAMTNWGGLLIQQLEMVNALLAHQAEVNVRNRAGSTPLGEAARVGNKPVVAVLLRAGATPDAVEGATGATPLHLAAVRGHGGIVQLLLESRAQVNATDARGDTPLVYALRGGRTNTIALLRQAGGTTGEMRALSPSEKSLVDFYEHNETMLRRANTAEKGRLLTALNPSKADLQRMFPQHAKAALTIVEALNSQIARAFAQNRRDTTEQREIWRVRTEPPGVVAQEWRARGWLAPDLPLFSLAVDQTGGTSRPGDFCFVNGHWVLVPPLHAIAAQEPAGK